MVREIVMVRGPVQGTDIDDPRGGRALRLGVPHVYAGYYSLRRANTVGLYLLSTLVDVTRIRRYDWGGTGLATLYRYMSSSSHRSEHLLGGY